MKWPSPVYLGQICVKNIFLMSKNDINSYYHLCLEHNESYLIRLASRQCFQP